MVMPFPLRAPRAALLAIGRGPFAAPPEKRRKARAEDAAVVRGAVGERKLTIYETKQVQIWPKKEFTKSGAHFFTISVPRDEFDGAASVVHALVSALVDAARRTLDEHGRQVDHGRTLLPLQNLLVHQTLGPVPVPAQFLGSFTYRFGKGSCKYVGIT